MPYREKYFRRLTGRVRNHPVVGFDIEGIGDEGGFILGVVYDGEPHVFHHRRAMLEHLLSMRYRGACLYAHNLVYDLGILAQPFDGDWELFDAKGRLIRAVFRDGAKHKWVFYDTGNLLPEVSVDYLGKIVGMPKMEKPPYLVDLTPEKVRAIRADPAKLEEVARYCVRDAQIVYEFALMFQGICNQLGGNHKATLASTAMDIYRHSFQPEDYERVPEWLNDYARRAYYGGRVEVFRYGYVENVKQYDFSSLYPSVARDLDFPHPGWLVYHPAPKDCSLILKYEGVSDVLIQAPRLFIPLLPARVGDRLVFPVGEWRGHYTHIELRRALELGYKILRVYSTVYATRTCRPLRAYMEALWELRLRYKREGSGMEKVIKFLLNGLTGKFGQRRDGGGRLYKRITKYEEFMKAKEATLVLWQGAPFLVRDVVRERDPVFVNVFWIAYITSAARLRLYDAIDSASGEVFYCDTDSVFTRRELPTGDGLGELKLEGQFKWVRFIRAKAKLGLTYDGQVVTTGKGVPSYLQEHFLRTGEVSWRRPTKLRTAFMKDMPLSIWIEVTRRLGATPTKRVPFRKIDPWSEATWSRPYTYDEACRVFRAASLEPWEGAPSSFEADLV